MSLVLVKSATTIFRIKHARFATSYAAGDVVNHCLKCLPSPPQAARRWVEQRIRAPILRLIRLQTSALWCPPRVAELVCLVHGIVRVACVRRGSAARCRA